LCQNPTTAGDWIGELAEAAKTHDQLTLKREHDRVRETQVIAANSQRLWERLVATVEGDVLRFQHEFAHDPKRSLMLERIAPNGFRVFSPVFPGVSLHVQLKLSGEAIEFKYCTVPGG